jgi:hypothetical protein
MLHAEGIENAVRGYVAGAQELINAKFAASYPNIVAMGGVPVLSVEFAVKYAKVFNNEHGRKTSIFAFINMENGDILKPATYKTPAKHARGNVFEDNYGLQHTTAYGPNYLR